MNIDKEKNLPLETQDPSIKKEDFVLTNKDKSIHDQKFQTKPTTFFKDSLKRFAKNKSSVVAAGILGLLLILAIFVPIFDTNDITSPHKEYQYLEPKLFEAGTGFWDGTKKFSNIPVDIHEDPEGTDKENTWWPNPDKFSVRSAISKKEFTDLSYTEDATKYSKGGYFKFGYFSYISEKDTYVPLSSSDIASFTLDDDIYLTKFDVCDDSKMQILDKDGEAIPDNTVLGEAALFLTYEATPADDKAGTPAVRDAIQILDYKAVHNIGSEVSSQSEEKVNVTSIIKASTTLTSFVKPQFQIRVKNENNGENTNVFIRSLAFEVDSVDLTFKKSIEEKGFLDASEFALRTKDNAGYWSLDNSSSTRGVHLAKSYFCSFVYDTYEAAFGKQIDTSYSVNNLENMDTNDIINWSFSPKRAWDDDKGEFYYTIDETCFTYEVLDEDRCELAEPITLEDIESHFNSSTGELSYVTATVYKYKQYGFTHMPKYIFGTDVSGRDMLKYVFEGLRTSLILGIITSAVCFIFGLIYGAISGYFGGTVDLIMERFTDILAGVPWIVVMTLAIIHLGQTFFVFALALCMTGWIGTAATTRTQFYRFRGREYVLASRTLGASDARLIAKHILPNAMGTIITSAVLMVPSVIFSEATLAYLNLGLKGLSSLGVILQAEQAELQSNAYLLIFPSVVIALLMISFNLFGNGLRDAVNPSLKGEGE